MADPNEPAAVDQIDQKHGLQKDKIAATRHVLREYSNKANATVFFVLDEMRKNSVEEGKTTTYWVQGWSHY